MNKVILIGRLTRDPEIRWTQGQDQKCTARYTLAVDRRRSSEGQQSADFISCISFGKTAEFLEKYGRKGIKFGAEGRIATGSYTDNEGKTVYTTNVVVDQLEFVESKGTGNNAAPAPSDNSNNGFMNIPDGIDEELPFV